MTIRTIAEIEPNAALTDALENWLHNIAAGESGEDKKYTEKMIDDLEHDRWTPALKRELMQYIFYRAGFDGIVFGVASDFSEDLPKKD